LTLFCLRVLTFIKHGGLPRWAARLSAGNIEITSEKSLQIYDSQTVKASNQPR
jgi:hypothetical protein